MQFHIAAETCMDGGLLTIFSSRLGLTQEGLIRKGAIQGFTVMESEKP